MKDVDRTLQFACPICGAQPMIQCEMLSGSLRILSHRKRRDATIEYSIELRDAAQV